MFTADGGSVVGEAELEVMVAWVSDDNPERANGERLGEVIP
jgi:hypothetical protein